MRAEIQFRNVIKNHGTGLKTLKKRIQKNAIQKDKQNEGVENFTKKLGNVMVSVIAHTPPSPRDSQPATAGAPLALRRSERHNTRLRPFHWAFRSARRSDASPTPGLKVRLRNKGDDGMSAG